MKQQVKLDSILSFLDKPFCEFSSKKDQDQYYFTYLLEEFSTLDIEEELKQYYAWTLDQDPNKTLNHHSRFRYWLKRAVLMRPKNN